MSHLQYLANRASPELRVPSAASRPALMRALTRRRLLRTMAGATGAALTAGAWTSALASPSLSIASSGPKPIPGGEFVIGGQLLHVNNLGVGSDESTIFNFNGRIASTFVLGQGTAGDGTRYGHFVDMRFMEGDYVGLDGRLHNGTFAFVWLDIFEDPVDPLSSTQIHDYNPNINSAGVFWTVPVPDDAVIVAQGRGRAVLEMTNMPMPDWFDFVNSVLMTVPAEHATVSFRVEWNLSGPYRTVENPAQDFRHWFQESTAPGGASIEWSAQNAGGFSFQSDPASQSTNVYANLGLERNGIFYP